MYNRHSQIIRLFFCKFLYEKSLAQIKENKMKKKIIALLLLFTIACEVNLGENDERDRNSGGGCEIRI